MLAALFYPDWVASLTLIATSPGGSDLPPMSEEFLAYISRARTRDWSDREAVIDHVIDLLRLFPGWFAPLRRSGHARPRGSRRRSHCQHRVEPDKTLRHGRG